MFSLGTPFTLASCFLTTGGGVAGTGDADFTSNLGLERDNFSGLSGLESCFSKTFFGFVCIGLDSLAGGGGCSSTLFFFFFFFPEESAPPEAENTGRSELRLTTLATMLSEISSGLLLSVVVLLASRSSFTELCALIFGLLGLVAGDEDASELLFCFFFLAVVGGVGCSVSGLFFLERGLLALELTLDSETGRSSTERRGLGC